MILALKIIAGIIIYIAFVFFIAACMGIYKKAGGYNEHEDYYYPYEKEVPNESNISNLD